MHPTEAFPSRLRICYSLARPASRTCGILVLFVLLIGPYSLGYLFVAPSEKFYTEGAIRMLATGDYLIPYMDGDPRFAKPVLAYWWEAASFYLLGIDYWSARLPYLLGGALLIWLTARLARLVAPEADYGPTAALLAAAHPLLILCASWIMTDMPLVVATTLGVYGAVGMMREGGRSPGFRYLFHLGFGLAVAAKGVPGLALGGLAALYMLSNPHRPVGWRWVFDPLPLALGLMLALGWYGYAYCTHREAFLATFLSDQVGERTSDDAFRMLKNTGLYVATLLYGLPFLAMALWRGSRLRRWYAGRPPLEKAFLGLCAAWGLFFTLTAPFFKVYYDRYFFPMIPLLAVVLASVLIERPMPRVDRFGRTFALGLYGLTAPLLLAACAFFGHRWEVWMALGLSLLGGALAQRLWRQTPEGPERGLLVTGLALMGVWLNLSSILMPVINPEMEKQAADSMKDYYGRAPAERTLLYLGETRSAAKFRLGAGGDFRFQRVDSLNGPMQRLHPGALIVLRENQLALLDSLPAPYHARPIGLKYRSVHQNRLLESLLPDQPRRLYLAEPLISGSIPSPAQPPSPTAGPIPGQCP